MALTRSLTDQGETRRKKVVGASSPAWRARMKEKGANCGSEGGRKM